MTALAASALIGLGVANSAPAQAADECKAFSTPSSPTAGIAIQKACDELAKGTVYSWGGGHHSRPGPSTGTIYNDGSSYFDDRNKVGLDCSGFMRWAWYEATGVDWGGVATGGMDSALTSHKFSRVTNGAYQAGDVFVYNGHTAMNLGGGKMVQAQGDIEGLNVRALRTSGTTGVYRYTGDGGTPVPPGNNPPDPNSVHIWASGVRIRKGPNTQSDVVTTVSDAYTRLSCQARGEKVTAEGYTNDIWSFSPGLGGYVNNIYLSGPADFGLPGCGGDTPPPVGGKPIHIWGTDVNVRAAANTSSTAVKTVSDQDASFSCQARGQEVQDSGYTNDIWSYSSALGGYVSNIYLKGPADFGLPACGGGTTGKTIHIWAKDVNVRSGAYTSTSVVRKASDQDANFTCQVHGEKISDAGYTNDIWSYSPGLGGYLNNIYLNGPADFGLATC